MRTRCVSSACRGSKDGGNCETMDRHSEYLGVVRSAMPVHRLEDSMLL